MKDVSPPVSIHFRVTMVPMCASDILLILCALYKEVLL